MLFEINIILELLICISSIPFNFLFFYIIFTSKEVDLKWRITLFLLFISSILMSFTHLARTLICVWISGFEMHPIYANFGNYYSLYIVYFHEIGFCLQSFSLLAFSLVILMTIFNQKSKFFENLGFFIFILISLGLSIFLPYFLYIVRERILTLLFFTTLDISTLLILIFASKKSKTHYKSKMGSVNLEQRYQLSQVLNWTKSMIPSVIFAKWTRFVSISSIIYVESKNGGEFERTLIYSIYNSFLDVFMILLAVGIFLRHRKFRKISKDLKTIDGHVIKQNPSQQDYISYLKNQWN
ncbi:unnamed protein product [Caenorhabditis angaria]|uniref:Uncharacterized protein n=1 Tax=Caenorhabditis angaria TaxID=860376 RepID=A0A9P1N783_9PELO|nr:unnamed protein product [Caenorhabditis angaria]